MTEAILNHRITLLLILILLLVGIYMLSGTVYAQVVKPDFKTDVKIKTDKEKEKLKLGEQPFSLEKMGLLEPTIQALEEAVNPDE